MKTVSNSSRPHRNSGTDACKRRAPNAGRFGSGPGGTRSGAGSLPGIASPTVSAPLAQQNWPWQECSPLLARHARLAIGQQVGLDCVIVAGSALALLDPDADEAAANIMTPARGPEPHSVSGRPRPPRVSSQCCVFGVSWSRDLLAECPGWGEIESPNCPTAGAHSILSGWNCTLFQEVRSEFGSDPSWFLLRRRRRGTRQCRRRPPISAAPARRRSRA